MARQVLVPELFVKGFSGRLYAMDGGSGEVMGTIPILKKKCRIIE
jgi:hypothetical protein